MSEPNETRAELLRIERAAADDLDIPLFEARRIIEAKIPPNVHEADYALYEFIAKGDFYGAIVFDDMREALLDGLKEVQ